jgi:hypothetical protein
MTAPESPRADVELTECEVTLLLDVWRAAGPGEASPVDVLPAVERILADRLAAVQAELEAERERRVTENDSEFLMRTLTPHQWEVIGRKVAAEVKSAEAERDDLRALRLAVETLADAAAIFVGLHPDDETKAVSRLRDALRAFRSADRAVLASPSTHTQRDTEAQRDARLDNLIEREERAAEGCLDCKAGEPHMCPDAQRDTETAAQALREAADAIWAREGGYTAGAQWGRADYAHWLRARADSLATGEGS